MTSLFEIIGPIMIGPSSSHTAGMARIGRIAGYIANISLKQIELEFSPKMKPIYIGHRSDVAIFGGILGIREDDPAIKNSLEQIRRLGISCSTGFLPPEQYPENTVRISLTGIEGERHTVIGTSVGGGSIVISNIDGLQLELAPISWYLLVWSRTLEVYDLPTAAKLQSGILENGNYLTCFCFPNGIPDGIENHLKKKVSITKYSIIEPLLSYGCDCKDAIKFSSCRDACEMAAKEEIDLCEVAIRYEIQRSGHTREMVIENMRQQWKQMKNSVQKGREGNKMLYNLTGGHDAEKLQRVVEERRSVSGGCIPAAVAAAIGVMEYNASMGCIVAAPTAGSSGIIPGIMRTLQETYHFTDEQIIKALFVCALAGVIMAERKVSFSGSVGGCQGEIGCSSALAAAGIAALFCKEAEIVMQAMALCMKNLLGLVCDPIAGPIEVPCIKRNAVGVANAFISADMALAGIVSYIPPDEVIDALVDVEQRLPPELKAATVGGLACTHTAQCLRRKIEQGNDYMLKAAVP